MGGSPTPHLTPSQQRLVLSVVLEEAIITVMSNHVYRFGQEVFQQVEGGAIGSRLTGAVARLTMDDWMDQYNEVLEDNGWTVYLNKKYVDDINLAVEDPEPEAAWCNFRCTGLGKRATSPNQGAHKRALTPECTTQLGIGVGKRALTPAHPDQVEVPLGKRAMTPNQSVPPPVPAGPPGVSKGALTPDHPGDPGELGKRVTTPDQLPQGPRLPLPPPPPC